MERMKTFKKIWKYKSMGEERKNGKDENIEKYDKITKYVQEEKKCRRESIITFKNKRRYENWKVNHLSKKK